VQSLNLKELAIGIFVGMLLQLIITTVNCGPVVAGYATDYRSIRHDVYLFAFFTRLLTERLT